MSDALARDARVRRAKEAVEIGPVALEPGEAAEAEQGTAKGCAPETQDVFEGMRHTEGPERGLDRRKPRLDGGAHDRDLLRRDAVAEQTEDLGAHKLERRARPGRLQEADATVERLGLAVRIREQHPLEARQRRRVVPPLRWELLETWAREGSEIGGRALQRRERCSARLVRQRDADVGARREPLEQAPLDAAQVLEAVHQDGGRVPCSEIGRHELRRPPPPGLEVAGAEALALRPVRREEGTEVVVDVTGVDEGRLELAERIGEALGKAAETRRSGHPMEPCPRDHPGDDECALRR